MTKKTSHAPNTKLFSSNAPIGRNKQVNKQVHQIGLMEKTRQTARNQFLELPLTYKRIKAHLPVAATVSISHHSSPCVDLVL
jgi:hypothetical protein